MNNNANKNEFIMLLTLLSLEMVFFLLLKECEERCERPLS